MNYTKGKWMVAITGKTMQRKDRLKIVADTPYEGITGTRYEGITRGEKETPICDLLQYGSYEEYEANAKLIAAAPELLEALKEILENGLHHDIENDTLSKAEDAIRKAEGK